MERTELNSNLNLKDIMDYSSIIIQSVDLNGDVIYVNDTWRNTLGYSDYDLFGKSVFSILSIKSIKEYKNILKMVKNGIEPGKQEITYLTHHGEEIILSGLISILKDKDGIIIGTSEFLRLTAYIDEPFNVTVPDHSRFHRINSFVHENRKAYNDNIILELEDLNSPINRFLDSI